MNAETTTPMFTEEELNLVVKALEMLAEDRRYGATLCQAHEEERAAELTEHAEQLEALLAKLNNP